MRALLLDVGLGNDVGGKVQPLAEVVETLRGEGVVVPLPGELGLEVTAGSEGLAGLDDLGHCQISVRGSLLPCGTYVEVLGVDLAVLWLVEVLLGDEDTLAEEVLMDLLAVGLGDQPMRAEISNEPALMEGRGFAYILPVFGVWWKLEACGLARSCCRISWWDEAR